MIHQNNPLGNSGVAGGDIALALMQDRGESDPSLSRAAWQQSSGTANIGNSAGA